MSNLEAEVSEPGVAQAVAKGKERLELPPVKPAITHVDSHAERCLVIHAFLRSLGMTDARGGVVLQMPLYQF